ncbi:claudin-23 [Sceloporus undulatus]|uniref:claudin-23 n=1 Tax=Sceloporus undulatus TaxID=8520 RepID=UPI001C4C6B85|nr:claudin-23 [Sceloporus undulatus]
MRTPTPMIVGIVLGPCGLVLNLTSTLAQGWRTVSNIPRESYDLIQQQGIWDFCNMYQSSHMTTCYNIEDTLGYFSQLPVQVAKGLMPASLVVTAIGLVVTTLGVRCWQYQPHHLLAGLGGLLLFISGLLSLIAISWYNYELYDLPAPTGSTLEVGYCLVLGYLASCMEIIGGISLTISFHECCKERKLRKAAKDTSYPPSNQQGPASVTAINSPSITDGRDLQTPYRNPALRYYSNSLNVLEDERASRSGSRFPCDSDL